MADTLREKLRGLVGEWEMSDLHSKAACSPESVRVKRRHQLAAILAESEEPDDCCDRNHAGLRDFLRGLHEGEHVNFHGGPQPWMGQDVALLAHKVAESDEPKPEESRYLRPIPGVPLPSPPDTREWDTPEGQTHYVGDDCEGGHREDLRRATNPANPLPLGHEFWDHTSNGECTLYGKCHFIGQNGLCGQPRSAHEPKP